MAVTSPVRAVVADTVGHLTLDRPEAINALTIGMVEELTRVLQEWRHDTEVDVVVLDGAGDRGFCAGGDVRVLREAVAAGAVEEARAFFRAEYRLDALVATYPKPVVAILDGVAMGGGIGLGGHASVRVVTERSRLAMPETRIGFSPDVGGTRLLAQAPGHVGTYLGLGARTMDAADAVHARFADALVPSDRLGHLLQALGERADPGTPAEVVWLFDETPERSPLEAARDWIDACYSAPTVAEILDRLRAFATHAPHPGLTLRADASRDPDAAARAASAAADLERLAPTALVATLAAIRRSAALPSLHDVLEQDYRAMSWFLGRPDLAEGIRARLVDKDDAPVWSPATLDAVDAAEIERVLGAAADPTDRVFG